MPASLLGIVLAFVAYFTIVPLLSLAVTGAAYSVQAPSVPLQEFRESAARYEIPAGLAANGIAIAALIPLCWLLMTRLHCVSFGRLSSVEGRLRRPYLALCLGIATFIIIGGTVLVTALQGQRLEIAPQPGWWGFVTVVAVVTPWQAAEEYLFRGYLLQALGSLMSSPWLGATVSSLLFAGLHGTRNPALFVDRFAFGLLASGLVILTGGLEAGIAAHIVNNLGAFTLPRSPPASPKSGSPHHHLGRRTHQRRHFRHLRRRRLCRGPTPALAQDNYRPTKPIQRGMRVREPVIVPSWPYLQP